MNKRDQEKKRKTSSLNTTVDLPTGPPSDGVNPGPVNEPISSGGFHENLDTQGGGTSGGHGSPYADTQYNGKTYVLDGDRMVDKKLVDKYGIDNLPPEERMANSFERSDFKNKVAQAHQAQATAAKTTSLGYDSESERAMRQQWANDVGVNEKSDENQDDPVFVAKQQLVDLIKGGHVDRMPDGNYFSYHGNGVWEFKDRDGRNIPASPQLIAQATKGQDEKNARYAGGTVTPTPVAPPAPITPLTGSTTDIFAGTRKRAPDSLTPPIKQTSPGIFPNNPAPNPAQVSGPHLFDTQGPTMAQPSIGGPAPNIFPKSNVTPSIVSGIGNNMGTVDRKTAPIGSPMGTGTLGTTQPAQRNANIFNSLRKPRQQPLGY